MGQGRGSREPEGEAGAGLAGRGVLMLALSVLVLLLPAGALAFPGTPGDSPRVDTPDDPDFDRCEADNEEAAPDCQSYAEEEYGTFGFSPDSANEAPVGGGSFHYATGTRYANCDQLDPRGKRANVLAEGTEVAGNPVAEALAECLQISGVRADGAWKYSTGDPGTAVAILDTGIRWQSAELVNKVRLNTGELPLPLADRSSPLVGGEDCSGFADAYDADANGAVNVLDYACDSRVAVDAGDSESDAILDASDLIATFSDGSFPGGIDGGVDDDGNGYVDDVAGWDFFDDDNDPYDASSCCSAGGHGTGRAVEAVAETDNGAGGVGMCPDCQVIPLRVWDTFVVPTDNFALGVIYAADNGASVVEGAVGGLTNTQFARSAFSYADEKGLALTMVSSDINSANHNYPTNYNEAIYVGGSLYDTAPNDTCTGPGGLPGVDLPEDFEPPPGFEEGCDEFLGLLDEGVGVSPSLQPTTTSFFRNSNLTQYGGKADIVLMGSTGSENTGQASGAAALLASFGREILGDDDPLSGNEIRQLLTMTAEDVLPENTGTIGLPDKANPGWDPHFGYGRVNLTEAMARIANDRGPIPAEDWPCEEAAETCVPPEAQIDAPDWFAPINVDRVPAEGLVVEGLAAAPHAAGGVGEWELEYACGQDALDTDFLPIPGGGVSGTGAVDGELGTLPRSMLVDLADNCNGEVTGDAGRPAGSAADGAWPADPYPNPDPERHAFQIRLTVHAEGDPANFGRYRKTLFAYRDDGNLAGWPRPLGTGSDPERLITGSGGEVSPRLYDIDGDNALDLVQGTSSGELYVIGSDGEPLDSFNGGEPVLTDRYATEVNHPVPAGVATPRASLRVPAIGDVDGDREPEIVASAGEHVYAWEADGSEVAGFPVRIDPDLSEPCVAGVPKPCFDAADRAITEDNHIKRGIFGSPALADLDGDGRLDVVTGSMDQHVYAWDGQGEPLDGFPVKLSSPGADGAEIVTSPAIAQLDGEGPPEVVIATNEVKAADPQFPSSIFDFFSAALEAATGANPVYAIHGDGTIVDGWPVDIGVAAGDLLPLVLPGHDAAVLDSDGDGDDEVSISAATALGGAGGARLVDGDGTTISSYANAAADSPDQGPVLNLADYPSIGDLSGTGNPYVLKGGLTLNGVVNLLAVNQNLPFSHVEQAWDPSTGAAVPGYPRATDDFQLVSQAAVARVAGDGPETHALVGTGLYQVHAYGPTGAEAAGWPKFTGGWTQTTPATGDVDGDGDLEVSVVTREGWSFMWQTGVDACGGSNEEWQSFHHDEFGSANYGTDARPPGTPSGLAASRLESGAVDLSWEAPGDDWLCGSAERFELRISDQPIDSPGDGTEVDASEPAPRAAAAGETESVTLSAAEVGDARYAAVLYRDDAGNWGRPAATVLPRPDDPGPPAADCEDAINGTDGRDRIRGAEAGERIRGRGGNDRIRGGRGNDCLFGNGGKDRVAGNAGADRLKGGSGKDRLKGGGGDDRISGNRDDDRVAGGAGDDTLRGGDGRDRVNGGGGDDKINVRGGGRDKVSCGRGSDTVKAGRRDRVRRDCERVELK